jgi:hypothetical protein
MKKKQSKENERGKNKEEKSTLKTKAKKIEQREKQPYNKRPSHPLNPPPSPYSKKTITRSPTKLDSSPTNFTSNYFLPFN